MDQRGGGYNINSFDILARCFLAIWALKKIGQNPSQVFSGWPSASQLFSGYPPGSQVFFLATPHLAIFSGYSASNFFLATCIWPFFSGCSASSQMFFGYLAST